MGGDFRAKAGKNLFNAVLIVLAGFAGDVGGVVFALYFCMKAVVGNDIRPFLVDVDVSKVV